MRSAAIRGCRCCSRIVTATRRRAAVCSLALNGYYAVADVAFAPDATFSLDDEA